MDAVGILCAQLTRDLFAIAKFLLQLRRDQNDTTMQIRQMAPNAGWIQPISTVLSTSTVGYDDIVSSKTTMLSNSEP